MSDQGLVLNGAYYGAFEGIGRIKDTEGIPDPRVSVIGPKGKKSGFVLADRFGGKGSYSNIKAAG